MYTGSERVLTESVFTKYDTDMSVQSATRKRLPPEERRGQILDVAAKVFSRKGYRRTSVSDIVEGAHIGRGTFYLYFNSKKDIFVELLESYFQGFEALLRENQERLHEVVRLSRDVISTLRDNLMRILEYNRDNSVLTSIVYGEAFTRDTDFSKRVEELLGLAMSQFRDELNLLQQAGLARPCDPEIASAQLLGATTYVLMAYLNKRNKADLDALADEILEYHLRAIVSPEFQEQALAALELYESGSLLPTPTI
jgi:AcrR family transcriptional regulator